MAPENLVFGMYGQPCQPPACQLHYSPWKLDLRISLFRTKDTTLQSHLVFHWKVHVWMTQLNTYNSSFLQKTTNTIQTRTELQIKYNILLRVYCFTQILWLLCLIKHVQLKIKPTLVHYLQHIFHLSKTERGGKQGLGNNYSFLY